MKELPDAQRETLEYLQGLPPGAPPPTYKELADHFGLKSIAPIQCRLDALRRKGYVASVPGKPRTLQVLRPDRAWVAVPQDMQAMVEALVGPPSREAAAIAERVISEWRKVCKEKAAAEYSGEPPL